MPGQRKVKTTYTKATRSPSSREPKAPQIEMRKPQPLSPLHQYVEDNKDSGVSVSELIEQFQEYDCEHQFEKTSTAPSKDTYVCAVCKKVKFVKNG